MKIVFNLCDVGIGDNGGSRTLIKCATVLKQLGHEVSFLFNHEYDCRIKRFTWFNYNIKSEYDQILKSCDVMIATGYNSAKHVKKSNKVPNNKKFYYIRGFELWNANESDLIKSYQGLKCIVNSEWLQNKLLKHNIQSKLIYPGIDNDIFKNHNIKRTIDIGFLHHVRHKTKNSDFAKIVVSKLIDKTFSRLNKDFWLDKNDKTKSEEEQCNWYNSIKVWFAPTVLEGLHNPPIEASLCGCGLVCSDAERSGMRDYAKHNETALVYKDGNLEQAVEYVETLLKDENLRNTLVHNMNELLNKKIGTRKENMEKMVNIFRNQ